MVELMSNFTNKSNQKVKLRLSAIQLTSTTDLAVNLAAIIRQLAKITCLSGDTIV